MRSMCKSKRHDADIKQNTDTVFTKVCTNQAKKGRSMYQAIRLQRGLVAATKDVPIKPQRRSMCSRHDVPVYCARHVERSNGSIESKC